MGFIHVFNDFWPRFLIARILTKFAPEVYYGILCQFLILIFTFEQQFIFHQKTAKVFYVFLIIFFKYFHMLGLPNSHLKCLFAFFVSFCYVFPISKKFIFFAKQVQRVLFMFFMILYQKFNLLEFSLNSSQKSIWRPLVFFCYFVYHLKNLIFLKGVSTVRGFIQGHAR